MPGESNLVSIKQKFKSLFKSEPLLVSAPGRINLIGEHTDYNNGFVLPAAIDKAICFGIRLNKENRYRFYAADLDEYFETTEISREAATKSWASYFLGVLAQFRKKGIDMPGVDCVFGGNIPVGAGLSSSAAVECGFASGLNQLLKTNIPKLELALMAQLAEHEYAGVMCGIMDQYASIFGKKDHVLRIDCRSVEHDYFPLPTKNLVIALCDTGVKHELSSSEYNIRRKECERGVSLLQKHHPSVQSLRDASKEMLQDHKDEFDEVTFKRCHYVVKENQRVLAACEALEAHDFTRFGELMYESHEGLQHEYEVSCDELDLLVSITRKMDFVFGARMMGGGFGGCTINLLKKIDIDNFQHQVETKYEAKTGTKPKIYFVSIEDGAHVLNSIP